MEEEEEEAEEEGAEEEGALQTRHGVDMVVVGGTALSECRRKGSGE